LRWQAGKYCSQCSDLDAGMPNDPAGFSSSKKTRDKPHCSSKIEVSSSVALSDSERAVGTDLWQ
jgi:hypothetical protein